MTFVEDFSFSYALYLHLSLLMCQKKENLDPPPPASNSLLFFISVMTHKCVNFEVTAKTPDHLFRSFNLVAGWPQTECWSTLLRERNP